MLPMPIEYPQTIPEEEIVLTVTQNGATASSYINNTVLLLPTGGLIESPVADFVSDTVSHVQKMPILPIDEDFDSIANEAFSSLYKGSKAKLIRKS